jgi:cytochrome c-type biogenesis protein CcmH
MNRTIAVALGIFVVVGVALFAMLAFFVAPNATYTAPSASSDLDAETIRVAKGLYCPVCPGVPLDVCDTQACEQWRGVIRQKLSAGETPPQIEAYFVEQYGERVLGAPRAQGLNLLIYALPAVAVASGASLLYLFAASRVGSRTAGPVTDPAVLNDTEMRQRIERELREND